MLNVQQNKISRKKKNKSKNPLGRSNTIHCYLTPKNIHATKK